MLFVFFYFVVNVSVAVFIFINFYCELLVMKIQAILKPKTLFFVCIFSLSNEVNFLFSTDCSFVKMTSYCLNTKSLNLWADVVQQSIITLIATFFSIEILLHCFLVLLLIYIFLFHDLNDILLYFLADVYDFHLTTIFHYCLLLLLCHFFQRLSTYINNIYIVYSTEISGLYICSLISLYFVNTLFAATNSSWLIYE